MVLGLEDLLKPELVSAGGPIEALLAANPFIPGYSLEKKDSMKCPEGFLGWRHPRFWLVGLGSPCLREGEEPTD